MYHISYCYISKYIYRCLNFYLYMHIYIYIYIHCLYVHVYDDMCRVLLLHDSCTLYICMIFHFATFTDLCIYIYVCIIFHIATFTNLYIYIYMLKHISICVCIYIYLYMIISTGCFDCMLLGLLSTMTGLG